jgi:hypothetical protein
MEKCLWPLVRQVLKSFPCSLRLWRSVPIAKDEQEKEGERN